jgi:LysR family transcriptional regulator, regulator of abg operon
MKNHQLRAFIAVAQHKSIRGAARALGLTQPAITRIVRELESDLAVPLVRRSAAGIELTEFGEALEIRARLLLEETRKTHEELSRIKHRAAGKVALAVSPTVAMTLLPKAFDLFTAHMPDAQVKLSENSPTPGMDGLRDGTLDLIVTHLLDEPEQPFLREFESLVLFKCSVVIGARRGHPRKDASCLSTLLRDRWCFQPYGYHGDELGNAIFRSNGLAQPHQVIQDQSFAVALGLAMSTDTLCLFTQPLFDSQCVPHGLEVVRVSDKLPAVTVAIVRRRGVLPTPAAQRFVECLTAAAQPLATLLQCTNDISGRILEHC